MRRLASPPLPGEGGAADVEGLASVDGVLVPRSDARLSIDDFAARYGAACFETMLARHGRVFRFQAHLDRLERGLRAMHVEPPARDSLAQMVRSTIEANGLADASVRLTVSAGRGGTPDLLAATGPSVVITVEPLPPPAPPAPPARLRIVSVRLDERRPMLEAKTANFLPYLLARAEARELGADDALLLNHSGAVTEAATANLFALIDGALTTPPVSDGPLPGITRAALIEVARETGVVCAERTIGVNALARAEAIVLTSSVQGMLGVASVVGEPPQSPAPLRWTARADEPEAVRRLRAGYEALVDRECGLADQEFPTSSVSR